MREYEHMVQSKLRTIAISCAVLCVVTPTLVSASEVNDYVDDNIQYATYARMGLDNEETLVDDMIIQPTIVIDDTIALLATSPVDVHDDHIMTISTDITDDTIVPSDVNDKIISEEVPVEDLELPVLDSAPVKSTKTITNNLLYTSDEFVYYPELKLSEDLQRYTYDRCEEIGLRYTLVLALMYRESGFCTDIVGVNKNGTTDSGLMQINDSARPFMADIGIIDLLNPYDNIDGGTYLLKYHIDNNGGSEVLGLMAYQYGQHGADVKFSQGIYSSSAIEKLYWIEDSIINDGVCPC